MKKKILSSLKKIKEISTDISNFVLLLPTYMIGIGISFLFWKVAKKSETKGSEKDTYWKKGKKILKSYEKCLKRY